VTTVVDFMYVQPQPGMITSVVNAFNTFSGFSYSHPAPAHSTLEEVVKPGAVGACRYESKVTADFICREIVHECVQQMPNSIAAAPRD
jgi:hypothetical protein